MPAVMKEVTVFVAINDNGDFVVSKDGEAEAAELLENEEGTSWGFRVVKVKVNVPLPVVLEANATIEEDAEATAQAG